MDVDVGVRMGHYVRGDLKSVTGWLAPESAEVICHLAIEQIHSGLRGGVGEIGIHHGKLFLLLYLSLREDERAFALDLFEDQTSNVDKSGLGDRAVFLQNLAKVGGNEDRISIFAANSCAVSAETLRAATGPLRLMSIDGGHTESVTYNDMELAEQLLLEEGVLILDDAYNERWPAVAAGAFRFLLEPHHHLRPFAISPNKTYFCKSNNAADRYRKILSDALPELRLSEAVVLGRKVLILGRRTLVNHIRNTPIVRNNPSIYRWLAALRQRLH
jgi:hypothetical protein